jgi:phosphatidylglycerol:prolipoprotein diacylglycerol transferase
MINIDPNPVLFQISSFRISFYLLVYVFGFLTVLYVLLKAAEKKEISLKKEECYSLIFYSLISILVFARVFHVLFWGLDYYSKYPMEIFYIWQGGVSFHGGLLGGFIILFLFCKKKKLNFWQLADLITLPLIVFLALARIGNFLNSEIIGKPSSLPWCVKFPNISQCAHPIQIYAALGRLIQFFFLFFISKTKKFKHGFIFWLFIFTSGIGRFFLDFLRLDPRYFYLSSGQWLSLSLVALSVFFLINSHKQDISSLKQIIQH